MTLATLHYSRLAEMARCKVDPKVLQKLAGHAKYSTTTNAYVHMDMEDKKAVLDLNRPIAESIPEKFCDSLVSGEPEKKTGQRKKPSDLRVHGARYKI